MADVFVSYARSDKARVAPLVAAIEAQGWSVWWDPEIDAGQEFDRPDRHRAQGRGAVVVVWTPTSVESRWVRGEAREAADRGVLVPVRFDGARACRSTCAPSTPPISTAGARIRRVPPLQELLRSLGAMINRQRAPPACASRRSRRRRHRPRQRASRSACCRSPT